MRVNIVQRARQPSLPCIAVTFPGLRAARARAWARDKARQLKEVVGAERAVAKTYTAVSARCVVYLYVRDPKLALTKLAEVAPHRSSVKLRAARPDRHR